MAMLPSADSSLLGDLIKIGIPSLVTIVSGAFTLVLGLAGHRKDRLIEKLRRDADRSRINSERKASLVMEIVVKMGAVDNAMAGYSGVFRSEGIDGNNPPSTAAVEKARAAFSEMGRAVDACIGALPQVHLLGEPKTSAAFTLFLQTLFGFQKYANPEKTMDPFKLTAESDKVNVQKVAVLAKLSAIYLDSTGS
ncbi:protein of unknown function [Burkholderia multivorans]